MQSVKISNGNTKIGNIPNINLPPVLTCLKDVPCSSDKCYALKAYKQYPNVRNAWNLNFDIFQNNSNFYFSNIIDQLKKKNKLERFRWHSSGDIVSQNYLDGVILIANEIKETKFLIYTKRNDLDFTQVKIPSNLRIRFSMWKNFENKTSLQKKSWISDDSRVPNNAFPCPGDCRKCEMCWSNIENIVFKKH